MDNLSRLVVACQQYQEGLITRQEWQWKMIECIGDCTDEDASAIASLVEQYSIHLRSGGH